uniref:Uncharacterized protein n=1 Tax=Glossina brevipalpis TaxID=37001 RepID=A0A1A9WKG1_9MUSC
MFKYKILWIFCYLLPMVWSDCILQFPNNMEHVPEWKTRIGKSWFKVPYITRGLLMKEGETFEGYCATKFNFEENRKCFYTIDYEDCNEASLSSDIENITATCVNGFLEYDGEIISPHNALSCNDVEWSVNQWEIIEINENENWCKDEHQIFMLNTKNLKPNRTLAYICYDLNEFSLQAIKYKTIHHQGDKANSNKSMPVTLSDLPATSSLSGEVKFLNRGFLHIQNELLQIQLEHISDTNAWLKLANYEYENIIQSGPYLKYFKQYHELLDILWWHNLRVTNWPRFLNALEQHTKIENTYEVHMGTLGEVHVPLWTNPNEMKYLEIENDFVNGTAPQYIWTYLESSDGKNPDLYVFAYNSPYAEFFNYNDVRFCHDICDNIAWLKDARSTFNFANFGVIFCCTLDSLKDSPYLQKLPQRVTNHRMMYQKENVSIPPPSSPSPPLAIENLKTNLKFKALESLNKIKEFLKKK